MERQQKIGLNRELTDQFYTDTQLAQKCFATFIEHVKPNLEKDIFIEPSAGKGAFSDIMFTNCKRLFAYDIEPKATHIIQQDFLQLDLSQWKDECIHCIGNPPFGRQSKLAKQFIKKCAEHSHSISFILPKSFKKTSFSRTFPANFHLVFEEDCPGDCFVVDNKSYDVPCVFQVWIRQEQPRAMQAKEEPSGFSFVKQNEEPSFALRRVGVYAGKLSSDDIASKSTQSHYFVKLDNSVDNTRFVEAFNNVAFDSKDNTVGPRSISKQEFTAEINKIIKHITQVSSSIPSS